MTEDMPQSYTRAEKRKIDETRRLISQLKREESLERMKVSMAIEDLTEYILSNQEEDPVLMKKKGSEGSVLTCLHCGSGEQD